MKNQPVFSCLVADPPWPFGDALPGGGRGAAKHYRCLSISEIMRFPLPPLANDCWLGLWRVGSMQEEAIAVVRAWGFRVTSEIVWVKTTKDGQRVRKGMGRTVRNAHEVMLVCRRGRPKRASMSVGSVVFAPIGKHSEKPAEAYEALEWLVGAEAQKVELFARINRPGWVCLGDEIQAAKAAE